MREWRGRRAGIRIEVRIAARWGDAGRGWGEEHQFQHVVPANLLVFSSFLLSSSVASSTLTSSRFISHPVKVARGGLFVSYRAQT